MNFQLKGPHRELIFTKLKNIVLLEQCHHKTTGMYGGLLTFVPGGNLGGTKFTNLVTNPCGGLKLDCLTWKPESCDHLVTLQVTLIYLLFTHIYQEYIEPGSSHDS